MHFLIRQRLALICAAMFALIVVGGRAADEEGGEAAPVSMRPVKISATEYRLGRLSFNPKTREIWFPCLVNQDEVLLEFGIAEETRGKLHESLLSTKVTPIEIQIAMKLLRWEASRRDIYLKYDDGGKPIGKLKDDGKGRMEILVRYKDGDAGERTEPIGNWMHNEQTKTVVGAGVWTYTGSKVVDGHFLATDDGAIAANYRYEGSLINAFNPGSDNDDLWFPIAEKVPPLGTEVTVILKPLPDVAVPATRRLAPVAESKPQPESQSPTEPQSKNPQGEPATTPEKK